MTRRPLVVPASRAGRALQTMAPGGSMAAEAPVPYDRTIRPPRVGGVGAVAGTPPTGMSSLWGLGTVSSVSHPLHPIPDVDFTDPGKHPFATPEPYWGWSVISDVVDGHAAVVVLVSLGNGDVAIPADWSLLDSGSVGGVLHWWVAWTTVSASTTWTFETGLAADYGSGGVGAFLVTYFGQQAGATPVVSTVSTNAGGSSVAAPPNPEWVLPCSLAFWIVDSFAAHDPPLLFGGDLPIEGVWDEPLTVDPSDAAIMAAWSTSQFGPDGSDATAGLGPWPSATPFEGVGDSSFYAVSLAVGWPP